MANTDKDILITTNKGQTADPKIEFKGADASTSAQTITATVTPTNNGTLSFDGSNGQLFSITNDFTGTIFSVNDVSGIPSLEVDASGTIRIAEFSGNVLVGTNSDDGINKVQINGNANFHYGQTYEGNIGRHPYHSSYYGIWNQDQYGNNTQKYMIINSGTDTYINGNTVFIRGDANSSTNQLAIGTSAQTIGGNQIIHAGNISSYTFYTHPTHPGDDIDVDTGALTGATVVSDIDINITTDTLGHVTDANGVISTRSLTAADIGAATSGHNHTYNVNNAWLRDNGDNAHVKLYGNSRQMAFRTDGTTEYSSGVGAYPFVWMYGGDASSNREMILNASGQLWLANYGWIHEYVPAKTYAFNLIFG